MIIVDAGRDKRTGELLPLDKAEDLAVLNLLAAALGENPDQEIISLRDLYDKDKPNPFLRLKKGEPIEIIGHGHPGFFGSARIPSVTLPKTHTYYNSQAPAGLGNQVTALLKQAKAPPRSIILSCCRGAMEANPPGNKNTHVPSLMFGMAKTLQENNLHHFTVKASIERFGYGYTGRDEPEMLQSMPDELKLKGGPSVSTIRDFHRAMDTYMDKAEKENFSIKRKAIGVGRMYKSYFENVWVAMKELGMQIDSEYVQVISRPGEIHQPRSALHTREKQAQIKDHLRFMKQYYLEQYAMLREKEERTPLEEMKYQIVSDALKGRTCHSDLRASTRELRNAQAPDKPITKEQVRARIVKLLPEHYAVPNPFIHETTAVAVASEKIQAELKAMNKENRNNPLVAAALKRCDNLLENEQQMHQSWRRHNRTSCSDEVRGAQAKAAKMLETEFMKMREQFFVLKTIDVHLKSLPSTSQELGKLVSSTKSTVEARAVSLSKVDDKSFRGKAGKVIERQRDKIALIKESLLEKLQQMEEALQNTDLIKEKFLKKSDGKKAMDAYMDGFRQEISDLAQQLDAISEQSRQLESAVQAQLATQTSYELGGQPKGGISSINDGDGYRQARDSSGPSEIERIPVNGNELTASEDELTASEDELTASDDEPQPMTPRI